MKSLYIIPILICFYFKKEICQCPPVDKKIIESIKTGSDFIGIGQAIEELKTKSPFETPMYRFKVDSIIKGQTKHQTIFINQNQAGNCSRFFNIGQKYYVIGNEVNHPKEVYTMTQKEHSKNLEKLINKNYVVSTDVCRSFSLTNPLIEYYFKD